MKSKKHLYCYNLNIRLRFTKKTEKIRRIELLITVIHNTVVLINIIVLYKTNLVAAILIIHLF